MRVPRVTFSWLKRVGEAQNYNRRRFFVDFSRRALVIASLREIIDRLSLSLSLLNGEISKHRNVIAAIKYKTQKCIEHLSRWRKRKKIIKKKETYREAARYYRYDYSEKYFLFFSDRRDPAWPLQTFIPYLLYTFVHWKQFWSFLLQWMIVNQCLT